jgi:hypothetical protein
MFGSITPSQLPLAGLDPAIPALFLGRLSVKTWTPGTNPGEGEKGSADAC